MRAKEIKNLAEDLRENYNTRNPFELADKFGIKSTYKQSASGG